MNKTKSGFTIVELLIVIVVIGILAAITIVAYNGIQTRAKNTKTVNAASAWIKAIKLYQADKGTSPVSSCLGSSTTYVGDSGQCWDGYTVSTSFLTSMQPYISNYPEPDSTYVNSAPQVRRGILWDTDNSTYWNLWVLITGTGSCPGVGAPQAATGTYTSGYYCRYTVSP